MAIIMTKPVEYYLGAALEAGECPALLLDWVAAVTDGTREDMQTLYNSRATLTDYSTGLRQEGFAAIRRYLKAEAPQDIVLCEVKVTPLTTKSAVYSGNYSFTDREGMRRETAFEIETARSNKCDPEQIVRHELWPYEDGAVEYLSMVFPAVRSFEMHEISPPA